MFVLQECSICFEDFAAELTPHSISCGHVFCQPCLQSLGSSSRTCPVCREPFQSTSIRKVICTFQEDPAGTQESESEALMWQAIHSAVESPNESDQRKSLVQNNSEANMTAENMSKNICAALSIMRILVQVEEKSSSLEEKLNTALAVEESLRDRISFLEAQLRDIGARSGPSSHDFKLLMVEVHKLQSAVGVIGKNTSDIARQMNSGPPSSLLLSTPTRPEVKPRTPPPVPVPNPRNPRSTTRRPSQSIASK
ncbi:Zinc finger, C3HC4 type (RING finger) protein [Ceratobasidium theobromae]|uniref:Zinc finger, C3HC4 type (RING finger) protein n=1 Tax=Ceratobasidium theobromae TaxID=1582974 RepID=A0A5N5QAI0_9AGAM|nr:Zinc finger, C3HC4 type (RING finger) protein [Ceratobasidium theobromae]